MDKNKNNQNEKGIGSTGIIVAIAIGIIIGFFVGVWYEKRSNLALDKNYAEDLSSTATDKDTIESDQTAKGDSAKVGDLASYVSTDDFASLVVTNQKSGETVNISSVTVSDTTWIAVREDDNGALGNILGARLVYQGATDDVSIDLLRPTAPSKMYHVVLYKDDGDRNFDYKLDSLIQKGGTNLIATFLTSEN